MSLWMKMCTKSERQQVHLAGNDWATSFDRCAEDSCIQTAKRQASEGRFRTQPEYIHCHRFHLAHDAAVQVSP